MEKLRIKEYCQLCLKLQVKEAPKIQITQIDQENFFKLTQKQLNTTTFCDLVCDSCFTEFKRVVKYRNSLINNQEILSNLYNSLSSVTVKEEHDSETFDWCVIKDDIKVETWEGDFEELNGTKLIEPAVNTRTEESIDDLVNTRTEAAIDDFSRDASFASESSVPEPFPDFPKRKVRKKPKNQAKIPVAAKKKIKRLDKPMICDDCGSLFYYRERLVTHIRVIHRSVTQICHICAKEFSNLKNLKRHLLVHQSEEEKRHQCDRCQKRFSELGNFLRHLRHHDGIKPHVCHICSRAFTQKTTLNEHLNIHNKARYKCELCPSDFSHPISLRKHMVKCSLGIPSVNHRTRLRGKNTPKRIQPIYNCYADGCTRKFTVREQLGKHLGKVHKIDTAYFDLTCHICQEVSKTSGDHLIHMKIHTCNFVCEHCQMRCKTAEALSVHIQNRHKDPNEDRSFVCDEPNCGAKFKNMGHLRSHIVVKHNTEKPRFECEFCKKPFHHRYILNAHMKSHSKERPFNCWQCDFNTASSSRLKIHMTSIHDETKIYKCKKCDDSFAYRKELLAHEKEH